MNLDKNNVEFDDEAQNIAVLEFLLTGKIIYPELARIKIGVGYLPARIYDIGKKGIRADREDFIHIKANGKPARMRKYWFNLEKPGLLEFGKSLLQKMQAASRKRYTVPSHLPSK
jgi:hypothetical protein